MMHNLIQMIFHASPLLVCLIVAIMLLLESSAVPLINTTLLLTAGALASQGHLNIWVLIATAILGSVSGACLAYVIGIRGVWMVFFSRMMPYVRPFGCFPAGISRMPFGRFFLAALAGSTIWCVVILNIGLALGRRWPVAIHLIRHFTVPTFSMLVLVIALYFLITSAVKRYLGSHAGSDSGSENGVDKQNNHDLLEV